MVLKSSMDECFPYKTVVIKPKQQKNPWMTNELKDLIKQKNKLYTKYMKKPITYGDEFKALRNRVSHRIRECKKQYYSAKFEAVRGDSKET